MQALSVFAEQMAFKGVVTWLYFGGKFGRNCHTCSMVNLLVAHQKMQNGWPILQYGITFIWVVIVARQVLNKERVVINIWVLTIKGPLLISTYDITSKRGTCTGRGGGGGIKGGRGEVTLQRPVVKGRSSWGDSGRSWGMGKELEGVEELG
jgi:hypothetical protein